MSVDKITEFLLVLVFALVVGTAGVLAVLCLDGLARGIALVGLLVAALASWQYLRRRFGRA